MKHRKKYADPEEKQKHLEKTQAQDQKKSTQKELPEITLDKLPEKIQASARAAGWKKLMPVQARAIPYARANIDHMVQSRTGSGKTGAFLMPLAEKLDASRNECQALILVPTRELAKQVSSEAEMLFGKSGIRNIAVYGGVGYNTQLKAFEEGAHVVVGTPGRLLDHLMRGALSLKGLKVLIFDEADRLLSMGFYPDMKKVQSFLPEKRLNINMFSATFPPRVISLAEQFMTTPSVLSLSEDHVHVTEIEHEYCIIRGMGKDRTLVRLIEVENPDSAIIFCNTRAQVDYVSELLKNFGYNAAGLSSDLSQNAREQIIRQIKDGKLRLVVATDVASRGLDIPNLSHVFLYEVPEDPEDYIHRAGRTGRAGASGTAISLVGLIEQLSLKRIAKRYGIDMLKREAPSDDDVQKVVSERLTIMLEARYRGMDGMQKERMRRFLPLAEVLAKGDEHHLTAILLDEMYHNALHAAPEMPELSERKPEDRNRQHSSRGRRPRSRGGSSDKRRSDSGSRDKGKR
ncbi:DEAD/DEAH box helicase [bacterium]|nr:DEAD/DEAH box helicase [bacterium]